MTPDEVNKMTVTQERATVEPAKNLPTNEHLTGMGRDEILEEEVEDVVETEGEQLPELLKRTLRPPVWMHYYERH